MRTLSLILMSLLGAMSQYSHAGTAVSGGGAAIVCRDQNKAITSAKLYDLFEGDVVYQLKINENNVDANVQLVSAIDKLQLWPFAQSYLKSVSTDIINRIQFLQPGLVLQAPSDLGTTEPVILPSGCALEGVGFYKSNGVLLVSADIFRKFSATDKAAFILHEGIYKIARLIGESTSADSRHFNAILFAANSTASDLALIRSTLPLVNDDAVVVHAQNPLTDFTVNVIFDDVLQPGRNSQLNYECIENYGDIDANTPYPSIFDEPGIPFSGSIQFNISSKPCLGIAVGAIEKNPNPGPVKPLMKIEVSQANGSMLAERTIDDYQGTEARYTLVLAYPDMIIPNIPMK